MKRYSSGRAEETGKAHEGGGQDAGDDEVHGGAADQPGYGGQLSFLPEPGHQHQGEGKSEARPQGIDQTLYQAITFVGGEDGEPDTVLAMTTMKLISRR